MYVSGDHLLGASADFFDFSSRLEEVPPLERDLVLELSDENPDGSGARDGLFPRGLSELGFLLIFRR